MSRVVVTGGSRGIGKVVAEALVAKGREVLVVARNPVAVGGGETLALDVADAAAWDAAAPQLTDVAGLVCAAGALGTPGPALEVTPEDFANVYGVNVLGTWLAVRACLPALQRSGGRVVTFAGGGATGPFARFDAYAASKAAIVRLTENLAADGVRVNAISPGFIVTDMQDGVLAAGPERVGQAYFDKVSQAVAQSGGDDPHAAADLACFLLSDAAAGISGKVLAARWDPWHEPAFLERLRVEPDLATLRRIDDQFFTAKEPS